MRVYARIVALATCLLALAATRTDAANNTSDKVVVGYWGDWESTDFPPDRIPWSQITHLNYAFALLNSDAAPTFSTSDLLTRTVKLAHANNVSVQISIGGWTGSQAFSTIVATKAKRTTFVQQVVAWVQQYGLNGVDIDWEYPGKQGQACNVFDAANDTPNFLLLLQELRAALDTAFPSSHKLITLAVATETFARNGQPITDTSAFAVPIDWVFIMAYDLYAGGATTGPNAPLNPPTDSTVGTPDSFITAINAWTGSGMPQSKIVMGLPLYGYAVTPKVDMSSGINMIVAADVANVPHGDQNDEMATEPCVKGSTETWSGVWTWGNIRNSSTLLVNILTPNAQYSLYWDYTSQTPWLYNAKSRIFITYDDPRSLGVKVAYARCRGVRGVGVWDVGQDYYDTTGSDAKGELLTTVDAIWDPIQGDVACDTITHPYPASQTLGSAAGHFGSGVVDRGGVWWGGCVALMMVWLMV